MKTVLSCTYVNIKQPSINILCNLVQNSFITRMRKDRTENFLLNNKKVRINLLISPAIVYGFRRMSEWKFTHAHLQSGGMIRATHCLPYSSRCQLGTVESHSCLSWADKKKRAEEKRRRKLQAGAKFSHIFKHSVQIKLWHPEFSVCKYLNPRHCHQLFWHLAVSVNSHITQSHASTRMQTRTSLGVQDTLTALTVLRHRNKKKDAIEFDICPFWMLRLISFSEESMWVFFIHL